MAKKKSIFDYMYILSATYLILGFFNILFAWLGMICFLVPLMMSIFGGKKAYCNNYCGRGQLFDVLGNKFKLSRYKDIPKWLRSKWFRYGFLAFFMTMFISMIANTYFVFKGVNNLQEVVTVLWTFKLPWNWVDVSNVTPWVVQFAFGFYSVMLTSTILGLITMILFKPRSWCTYCPMGSMTQSICKIKYKNMLK
ncbi:MAG: 4Fe-4S binding protein [Peptostreptococcaceae bacterium]